MYYEMINLIKFKKQIKSFDKILDQKIEIITGTLKLWDLDMNNLLEEFDKTYNNSNMQDNFKNNCCFRVLYLRKKENNKK